MTMENLFSQMSLRNKQLTDRYSEYTDPAHEQQVYYTYEPAAPVHHVTHVATSKHNYGGGHKSGASMSALTLLAFLFFLHILQQCIKDHMAEMSTPPVVVMTAGREGEETVPKTISSNKFDKTGITPTKSMDDNSFETHATDAKHVLEEYNAKNPYGDDTSSENQLLKINAEEYTPKSSIHKFKYIYKSHANESSIFPHHVNAMDENKK